MADFTSRLAKGDTALYLTTQDALVDEDGFPELLTTPLKNLSLNLPLKPAIMGNLVPQSINVWIGCCGDGTSSGLHHDFHDNLYVLLKGKKLFKLFPPELASRMYTNGKIAKIHPNGRFVLPASDAA
jgi:hypothetical protein